MKNNWYAIEGGPSSGKTTTIEILKRRGYKTVDESARQYYQSQIDAGVTNEEIRANPQKLQDSIAQMQIDIETKLDSNETIFFDSGIPHVAAYYDFYGIETPDFVKEAVEKCYYKKIFFLERLPMIKDDIRSESDQEAQKISDLIFATYSKLPLEIIKVLVMSPEERVKFILSLV